MAETAEKTKIKLPTWASAIKGWVGRYRFSLLAGFLTFAVGCFWWYGLLPAIMSPDSISQWGQALRFEFSNSHPYSYTLIIAVVQRLFGQDPIFVALLQLLFSSLLIAYIVNTLLRFNLSKYLVMAAVLVFILNPLNSIFAVTIWKDIPFTYGLVFVIFLLLNLYRDNQLKTVQKPSSVVVMQVAMLAIATVLTASFRHNGLVLILIVPMLVLFLKIWTRKLRIIFIGLVIFLALFQISILPNILNVKPSNFFSRTPMIQMMAASLSAGYEPTKEQKEVLDVSYPTGLYTENYNCETHNDIIYTTDEEGTVLLQRAAFDNETYRGQFDQVTREIILNNIPQVMADRTCMFVNMMGWGTNRSLNWMSLSDNDYEFERQQTRTSDYVLEFRRTAYTDNYIYTLWNPTLYLLPTLGLLFFVRKKEYLIPLLIIVANLGFLFMFNVSHNFRYVYWLVYLAPFTLAFLLHELKKIKINFKDLL